MKGLPLAYNKDMQEDKESIFDACDTVEICLDVMAGMISTMKANETEMRKACPGIASEYIAVCAAVHDRHLQAPACAVRASSLRAKSSRMLLLD